MPTLHAREQRARRLANRLGFRLVKSRARDPHAIDFGGYGLIDVETGGSIFPHALGRYVACNDLGDVEEWLADHSMAGA